MAAIKSKLYVVGSIGEGVLFVTLKPFRAVMLPDELFKKHAEETTKPSKYGYAKVAAAVWELITSTNLELSPVNKESRKGVESLVASGVRMTNADFAFVAEVDVVKGDYNRSSLLPIEDPLETLAGKNPKAPEGSLTEAVLSDTAKEPKP